MVVRKRENVFISDPDFWKYVTDDVALFQWDPPSQSPNDNDDILLDVTISDQTGQAEICAVPASVMPKLDVGRTFKVYHATQNKRGCDVYPSDAFDFTHIDTSKAVVVERGDCTFLHKVQRAKKAGYDLVIVVDRTLTTTERFVPSLLTEEGTILPDDELIPLLLVIGSSESELLAHAEQARVAGTKKHERRMIVRGGISNV